MTLRTWSAATFCIYFFALAARGDVITVNNGDRLNGTVSKLEKGKLYLKTTYAGTVAIDWDKITNIEAEGRYEVEVETGKRFTGEIAREADRVNLRYEDVVLALRTPDVVSAVRLENNEPPGFWKTLRGQVGLGYSFTRGNARQTQSSLTAQGDYRKETYRLQGDVTSILARQEEAQTTSRHALNGRYDRYLSDRAFAFGLTSFERNDRQKLDLRSRFGGGFGWKAAKSRANELDLLGGFTLTNEQFRNGDGSGMLPPETTGEGLFGFEWKNTKLPGVRLYTRLTAHPNLVQNGRYRIEYDSKAQVPLMGGLNWTVGLFDRYDSAPPRENVLRNDYGLVSTFGFSF